VAPLVLIVNDIPKHGLVREKIFVLNPILVNGPEVRCDIMLVLWDKVRGSVYQRKDVNIRMKGPTLDASHEAAYMM